MTKDINKEIQDGIYEKIYQFSKVFQPHPQDSPIIDLCDDQRDGNLIYDPEIKEDLYGAKKNNHISSKAYYMESILQLFIL